MSPQMTLMGRVPRAPNGFPAFSMPVMATHDTFHHSFYSLYAIARPSVVCLSSVTFVRPTQAVQIFGNISTALGTLAIH